jgi:IclR family acetate operon transcriptional repressor
VSAILERSFDVLKHLAAEPAGCGLSTIASHLELPVSATHRILAELCRLGYVRQESQQGNYVLTMKIVSLGLNFLSNSGVVDVAQPLLDRLAAEAGELVRLAVVDGDELTFVAKAQGARSGLRYDPDMGLSVQLSCSAAGHAWLSTMTDEEALQVMARQGFGKPQDFGPNAPTTMNAVLACIRTARKCGFSVIRDMFAPGMSSMGTPLRGSDGVAIGVITIAGPTVRFTEERMLAVAPLLLSTAEEVVGLSGASQMLKKRA